MNSDTTPLRDVLKLIIQHDLSVIEIRKEVDGSTTVFFRTNEIGENNQPKKLLAFNTKGGEK